jgi:hypothetical protein
MHLTSFAVQNSDTKCAGLINSGEEVPGMLPHSIIVGCTISGAIDNLGTTYTGRTDPLDLI